MSAPIYNMWLLFSILSAITAALMTIVAKIGLKNLDPTLATGLRSIIMFAFMASVVVIQGKLKSITALDSRALLAIVISGIFGALSWLFYFIALKDGNAAKVSAIDRSSLLFVILFTTIFLGEKLGLQTAVGGILATAGIILIALS